MLLATVKARLLNAIDGELIAHAIHWTRFESAYVFHARLEARATRHDLQERGRTRSVWHCMP